MRQSTQYKNSGIREVERITSAGQKELQVQLPLQITSLFCFSF
jgi:hypothetical protein